MQVDYNNGKIGLHINKQKTEIMTNLVLGGQITVNNKNIEVSEYR